MDLIEFLLLCLFPVFLLIALIIVLRIIGGREIKRKRELKELAEEIGLAFIPDGDPKLLARFSTCEFFNRGHSPKITNLIHGDSGDVKLAIFDYVYYLGSGENTDFRRQSVVSLQSSDLVCPDFTIRPENLLDGIGSVLGKQDIDFDDHKAFSSKFVLQGSDEQQVRQYFDRETLDFFTARSDIRVEASTGTLLYYSKGYKRIHPNQIKDSLAKAYEIFGMMVGRQYKGDAEAQNNFGQKFHYGEGVPKDFVEAMKWYRLAAEQEYEYAQFNLGDMYYEGEGVPQDFVEAMRWYRLAAAQENAGAQYVLGRMYYEGEGVPKDFAEAMNWFEKSALQKDIDAMFALGREHGESNVFPKNEAEAYAWYSMVKLYAEEELYPDEEEHNYNDELSSSLASLDRLNSSFSPEQMSAAQKRVAELQKEIEAIELARPV